MTDRIQALIVYLDDDYRAGDSIMIDSIEGSARVIAPTDADGIVWAIRMIKGVADVTPVVADFEDLIARDRARREIREQVMDVLYPRDRA